MPYVNIKITREGATPEQKKRLIQGATDLLVEVLGKNPKTTVVVIDRLRGKPRLQGGVKSADGAAVRYGVSSAASAAARCTDG